MAEVKSKTPEDKKSMNKMRQTARVLVNGLLDTQKVPFTKHSAAMQATAVRLLLKEIPESMPTKFYLTLRLSQTVLYTMRCRISSFRIPLIRYDLSITVRFDLNSISISFNSNLLRADSNRGKLN